MLGSWGWAPSRYATLCPSAAICASARSTKITPRASTCWPRAGWIRTSNRHASSGSAMTMKKFTSVPLFAGESLGHRRDQGGELGEDITGFRYAAHLGRDLHGGSAGPLRHLVAGVGAVVRLVHDHLDARLLHRLGQLGDVSRTGRDAGLGLDGSEELQPEAFGEVVEVPVIGHDGHPLV